MERESGKPINDSHDSTFFCKFIHSGHPLFFKLENHFWLTCHAEKGSTNGVRLINFSLVKKTPDCGADTCFLQFRQTFEKKRKLLFLRVEKDSVTPMSSYIPTVVDVALVSHVISPRQETVQTWTRAQNINKFNDER